MQWIATLKLTRKRRAAALAVLALAGCGDDEARLPAACREGERAVREALKAAPDVVRIDGTPLSACLGDESDAGELQDVGAAYLGTASALADEAARDPNGPEATQLGYLMGAVRRAPPPDQGVNYELLRRLEQELARVDTGSAAYRRGERAGRQSG